MPVPKKEMSPYPIDLMLSVIDGRWKGTILWRLLEGPMRTSELRRSIPEITERMLIRHLHELVEDGILVRHDKGTVPPSVSLLDFRVWNDACSSNGEDLRMGQEAPGATEEKDEGSGVKGTELLAHAQRLQAIAQAGLAYATSNYDVERYEEVRTLSVRLLQALTDEPFEKIVRDFASGEGYQTPKVDVRAVVFRGIDEVLLVREKIDHGRWTLPGGWADIGYTPFEVAEKEALEETGLVVKPVRLLALLDKRQHDHPPQPGYVYKAFIRCEIVGGALALETSETDGAQWFTKDEIARLELSTDRVTKGQLEMLFQYAEEPDLPAVCD